MVGIVADTPNVAIRSKASDISKAVQAAIDRLGLSYIERHLNVTDSTPQTLSSLEKLIHFAYGKTDEVVSLVKDMRGINGPWWKEISHVAELGVEKKLESFVGKIANVMPLLQSAKRSVEINYAPTATDSLLEEDVVDDPRIVYLDVVKDSGSCTDSGACQSSGSCNCDLRVLCESMSVVDAPRVCEVVCA